jgi:hypothetical protein
MVALQLLPFVNCVHAVFQDYARTAQLLLRVMTRAMNC